MADKNQIFIKHLLIRLAEHLNVDFCNCDICLECLALKSETHSPNPAVVSLSEYPCTDTKSESSKKRSGNKRKLATKADNASESFENILINDSGFEHVFDDVIVDPAPEFEPRLAMTNTAYCGQVSRPKQSVSTPSTSKRRRCLSSNHPAKGIMGRCSPGSFFAPPDAFLLELKEARIHLQRCDEPAATASNANFSLITNDISDILTVTLNDSLENVPSVLPTDHPLISAIEAIPSIEKSPVKTPQEHSASLSTQSFEHTIDKDLDNSLIGEFDEILLNTLTNDENLNTTSLFTVDSLRTIIMDNKNDEAKQKSRTPKASKSGKVAEFGKKLTQMYEEKDLSLWDNGRLLNGESRCILYEILYDYEKRSSKKATLAVVRYATRKILEKKRETSDTLLEDEFLPKFDWCCDELAFYIRFKAFLSI